MPSLFEPHIAAMVKFCRGRRPQNQCLFGIDMDGNLICDENPGAYGASLKGDYREQIQFHGGDDCATIEHGVLLSGCY